MSRCNNTKANADQIQAEELKVEMYKLMAAFQQMRVSSPNARSSLSRCDRDTLTILPQIDQNKVMFDPLATQMVNPSKMTHC